MSSTHTVSNTYSVVDVEAAFRRFHADIFMIADSTGAITREKAGDYAHDAEQLARRRYLQSVDVTLVKDGKELKASRYTVNNEAAGLSTSRPGGVLWPRMQGASIRVVLSYTAAYTAEHKEAMRSKLRISWSPTSADISHTALSALGSRDYVSRSFGLQRSDYG